MDSYLMNEGRLPEALDARIQSELDRGEKLVWTGQPIPRRFTRQSLPIVLFGIPWTAFSVFWMAGASGMLFGVGGNKAAGLDVFHVVFPLFGLPFVIIGLAMLSSPFWIRRKALGTLYALTDQRAILWEAGWFGAVEVRSYRPRDLTKMHRLEFANGDGDLVFEEVITFGSNSNGSRTTNTQRHGFLGVSNVREVEQLLKRTLNPDAHDE